MTSDPAAPPHELVRAEEPAGTTALRVRRTARGDVLELVVDGVFAMDSAHVATEEALARLALDRVPGAHGLHVVVGGLGLGYTAATALADPRVTACTVVELSAALVGWARDGLVPVASAVLADPRCAVSVGDVAVVVPALAPESVDAVLLDVDNGPDFLVHTANAGLYTPALLTGCARALRAAGVLAVWSADRSPALATALGAHVGPCEEVVLPVERDGRTFDYALYLARRA